MMMNKLSLSILLAMALLTSSCQKTDQAVDPQVGLEAAGVGKADQAARKGNDDKPGDDKGKHSEPGDDKGGNGKHNEPGDDKGGKGKHDEPGDDKGGSSHK